MKEVTEIVEIGVILNSRHGIYERFHCGREVLISIDKFLIDY